MAAVTGSGTHSRYRLAQEREFYNEDSASHYAPWDHDSNKKFVPQPSKDPALTSYAQLSAIRLGTERALISLFDRTHQHVLAEATPTVSIVGGHTTNDSERLKLGCCVFPKERGLCYYVETSRSQDKENGRKDSALVSLDVAKDERFTTNKLQLLGPLSDVRFFAAVPILSPRNFRIGVVCVMDSKVRSSAPDSHALQFLNDMAATVMDHLEMKDIKRRNRRAEKMIVGLGSFVEGRSTLRDSWREANAQRDDSKQSGQSNEEKSGKEQEDMQKLAKETEKTSHKKLVVLEPPNKTDDTEKPDVEDTHDTQSDSAQSHQSSNSGNVTPKQNEGENQQQQPGVQFTQNGTSVRSVRAGESLKDKTLPNSIRKILSRAANLLRESIGAEGVMFLDANSERFGSLVNHNNRRVSGPPRLKNSTSSSDESTDSAFSDSRRSSDAGQGSESDEHSGVSECLGFSSSGTSNDEDRVGHEIIVPEPLFTSLIRRYPRGKIFTYNASGTLSDSDDPTQSVSGSDRSGVSGNSTNVPSGKRRRKPAFQRDADDLITIFRGARNILLLPIWDSDRKRWFAGALAWTNEPDRIFTFENELVYISAFTNSIMAEVRRVDVEIAEKAKTNLVSSITHELRNPLHGILGTADILSDTAMNALQHGMVHTIESCGRTLLDTINNLLDLTFIDQYKQGGNSRKGRKSRTIPSREMSSYSRVSLDSVLEEVTECVFAGYCFYNHPQAPPPALTESSSRSAGQASKADAVGPRASQVTVIFDIEPDTEWDFYTHAGAWRRILMNIFGNALKYTTSGYIYLELKSGHSGTESSQKSSSKHRKDEFQVTLTVKDTGKGIGAEYLQNGVFSPFSQEDPLASGSGLGLSIVHQAVGFLGGSIEIESTKGAGTTLSIHTPLMRPPTGSEASSSASLFHSLRRYTEDKTIGFLGFGQNLRSQRDTYLYSSLERMCHEWFGLEVTKVSPLEGKHSPFNFYLAVQTELDCEDVGGRNLFHLSQHLHKEGDWTSPVVVICQSPEEAHSMFVASRNRGDTTFFEFVSQPCGPRKLARALDMCIKRQRDKETGRRGSNEPTRWVEMPESSHLPVDLGPSDPPDDRMKISKRPTADTIGRDRGKEGQNSRRSSVEESQQPVQTGVPAQPTPPSNSGEGKTQPHKPAVLLVDDNDLNLQLLCAYAQKDGYEYMTAQNGREAVETYRDHPGKFQAIIIDISMPIMDGFEASRQIRRLEKEHRNRLSETEQNATPRIIIAALTGLDSAAAQKEALGSGIDSFLIKPIKRSEVQAILRRQ
ncbi:uncharacterized protein N7503_008770 [Penicillium pulvis]|uniref:uncharacterized protein n=1 Tax=Penicillium pulvis TaxID=1562058 RepID=UPI002547B937|nr:uncharacterized protein N7503_008770 [Penicillium pulvis]KAJ5792792.1 hypothetical protein N7503_008770 [Penicillium pulvis]